MNTLKAAHTKMEPQTYITDKFGRVHDYLRISLTERCNLRCFYCMPEEGIELTEKSNLMSHEEVILIAKEFVDLGVNKIRLTGGEPLIKKNIEKIIRELAAMPINLGLTTNGILLDKYFDLLKESGVKDINVSLDTLDKEKFHKITRRDYFERVTNNIDTYVKAGFNIKINAVLIKGMNDDEIIDFVEYTKDKNISIRFIEFMPFDGNKWDTEKVVSLKDVLNKLSARYSKDQLVKLEDKKNDTTKNYKIEGYQGSFGVISTVSNPFCDSCNRVRLTANGKIKNCLFSADEANILESLRNGDDVKETILAGVYHKKKVRGGMELDKDFFNEKNYTKNRTMVAIGG